MKLTVINTGSNGNAYLLNYAKGHNILLDCGTPLKILLRTINYDLLSMTAVFVTHEHNDHALSSFKLSEKTLKVIGPSGAAECVVEPLKHYRIGDIEFMPLKVPHDDVENFAYLIWLPDGNNIFYATDYSYIPYIVKDVKVKNFLLECNNVADDLDTSEAKYRHVVRGHASLNTVLSYLLVSGNDETKNIILCHASAFSDKKRMVEAVKAQHPGANVYMAHKDDVFEL